MPRQVKEKEKAQKHTAPNTLKQQQYNAKYRPPIYCNIFFFFFVYFMEIIFSIKRGKK